MKIRIITLCFLLLLSGVLAAQTTKEKEKAKEQGIELADKKGGAKEAADRAAKKKAKEAAKLADQKSKKKEVNWQTISKLVVPPGQSFQLKSNQVQIDTLVMHPSSKLSLAEGDNIMIIGYAQVGPKTYIVGRGKNGTNGRDGKDGTAIPRRRAAVDGFKGTNGTNGKNAPNLKLYLGGISKRFSINVLLIGGNGGAGGNGGNGGTVTTRCNTKVKETNGGDAGQNGAGGAGGELVLTFGNGVKTRSVTFKSTPGNSGSFGLPGAAGWVLIKCFGVVKRIRPGKPGRPSSTPSIRNKLSTNPDFLEFPSPVPNPSAKSTVPISISAGASFSIVDAKLAAALNACGYKDLNYRKFKDGFAIFTGMEHITDKGVPLAGNDRFSPKPVKFYDDPSLISYLKSLFIARTGYSRIIVFIVTAEGIDTEGGGVARSEAINWLQSGKDELPQSLKGLSFTKNHKVKALIYEFSKSENGSKPVFSEPSLIDVNADVHLKRAKLWSLLISN